ncbi:Cytochrome c1 heme lyase [Acarospora aff. strigata]|nr:Cytochrome c1 heme lyase [Acarospora aff. strigata]
MANTSDDQACPVDHTARAAWLKKSREARQAAESAPMTFTAAAGESCDSSTMDQSLPTKLPFPIPGISKAGILANDREVSTIPRTDPSSPPRTTTPDPTSKPANNERDTGSDFRTGNWIYPSEKMFFEAMRRKNYDPQVEDMRSIVPIHNAVNERAWAEIKSWERGRGADRCGGPRLDSFSGLTTSMSPKARFNTLLGYHAPFDRHDWVVDRCGTKVEYVIDFYAGKDEGKKGKSLNFYLDVRPKLNSWEGWKMRVGKFIRP